MTLRFTLDPVSDNYAVMGNPVAHSKSPKIHHAFAVQTGQTIHYQALFVEKDGFVEALAHFQRLGGKGLNVTLPFKGDAWQAADIKTGRAQKARSVNTIWFGEQGERHGDTTDGVGLVADLKNHGIEIKNRRVLILGAGGAVHGVLSSIIDEQPDSLVISNRTMERAVKLKDQFSEYSGMQAIPLEQLGGNVFDLVINGTSAGLYNQMPSLPDNILGTRSCCYDMAYGETETVFVKWSRQHGARIALDGLGMLVEQAAESFYIWRGVRPDTKPILDMLRKS